MDAGPVESETADPDDGAPGIGHHQATHAGLLFAATAMIPAYLSRNDHRQFAVGARNKWGSACDPKCEHSIFADSVVKAWQDDRPHFWGIKPGLPAIGSDGERLAKFPEPRNAADAWHGYPVSARDPKREFEHRPRPALVERWREAGLLSNSQAARMNRGKV